MPQIVCNRLGGMLADPRRWPRPNRDGVIDELPTQLARNVTFYRGQPEGRRGQRQVYAPLTTPPVETASTECNGPVMLIGRHVSPTGMEYLITAGYYLTASRPVLVVTVFADRQELTSQQFYTFPINVSEDARDQKLCGQSFGNSFIITGPMLNGVRLVAGVTTPPQVGFIRVRFQRTGITIREAELFDRELVGFGPGDDDAPWMARVPPAVGMCVFNQRLIVAFKNGFIASNTGDAFAFSTTKFIPVPGEGAVTAVAASSKYLLVFKERSAYFVTGGLTSVSDTSVDVVDSQRGCVSQQSVVAVDGGHIVLAHDGVWLVRPGASSVELSADIWTLMSGDVRDEWSYDLSAYIPTKASFEGAPAAWLPQRRELVIALSNGKALNAVTTGVPQHEQARNLWFVMSLSSGKPQWSVWDGRIGESLLGYIDADGFDTLLNGTHRGRVFISNVADTDLVDDNGQDGSAGVETLTYTVELVPIPVSLPTSRAIDIQEIALSYTETRRDTAGAWKVRYGAGQGNGSFDGSYREVALLGTGVMPGWDTAYPITMRTPAHVRRTTGTRGMSPEDSVYIALRSTKAAPAITSGPRITYELDSLEET